MRAAGTMRPWSCGRADTMEWPLLTVALNRTRGHRRRTPSCSAVRLAGRTGRLQPDAAGGVGFGDLPQRASPMPAAAASPLRSPDGAACPVCPGHRRGPGIARSRCGDGGPHRRPGYRQCPPPGGRFHRSPAGPAGTTVTLSRRLPDGAVISAADIARIVGALGSRPRSKPGRRIANPEYRTDRQPDGTAHPPG